VFDRLGAFSGSFDAAAAEVVAGDEQLESWDVLDAVSDLVGKSMVVREPRSDGTRYTLLETLRQYARERLEERGEADTVRRRHARHYAAVAAAIEAALRSADELAARRRLNDDLDNLRAAVTWALDREARDERSFGYQIIAHLSLETNWDRTVGVGTWGWRAAPSVDDMDPWVQSAVFAAAAEEHRANLEYDTTLAFASRALQYGVTLPGAGPTLALLTRGSVLAVTGRTEQAFEELVEAKDQMERAGVDPYNLAVVVIIAGVYAGFAQNTAEAERLAEEGLAMARRDGSPTLLAGALYALGNAIEHRDPDAALSRYEEAIAIIHTGVASSALGAALSYAALLLHRAGETQLAFARAIEAVEHSWRVRDLTNLAGGIVSGAIVLQRLGQPALATTFIAGCAETTIGLNEIALHDPRWNVAELQVTLRAELGDAAYAEAWARGASMTPDDVVAFSIAEMRRTQEQFAAQVTP